MKKVLLFLALCSAISGISQDNFRIIPAQSFSTNDPVFGPFSETEAPFWYRSKTVSIQEFEISELVTFKDYKEFLKDQLGKPWSRVL